jgi:hypothetical protein
LAVKTTGIRFRSAIKTSSRNNFTPREAIDLRHG